MILRWSACFLLLLDWLWGLLGATIGDLTNKGWINVQYYLVV